jgi:Protein of unknown function (DUF3142)
MVRVPPKLRPLIFPLLLAALCLHTRGDSDPAGLYAAMPFPAAMPRTVLWAWEEPENLSAAPVDSVGVAYLAETLLLHKADNNSPAAPALTIRFRRQPLAVAPGAAVMAVVRIIAEPDFQDSAELRRQTAIALAEAARQPHLRALQIDFDATRSQRPFYAAVLTALRPQMPAGMPLSITALLSWCAAAPGSGDWMVNLPIDEAVPMFFRLGGSSRPGDNKSGYPIRDPHCRGSIGISTDESWPRLDPQQRVYLFAPRPWTPLQLAAVQNLPSGRAPALQPNPAAFNLRVNDTGLHHLNDADESNVDEKEDLP